MVQTSHSLRTLHRVVVPYHGLPGKHTALRTVLSGALRVLVIAIGVVMALEQLGLATAVVRTAFAITSGALILGLAIAAPHF